MDPLTLEHLVSCEASAGSRLLALGIWGDGVPCNWDRSESAECFTMNFPGQSGKSSLLGCLSLLSVANRSLSTPGSTSWVSSAGRCASLPRGFGLWLGMTLLRSARPTATEPSTPASLWVSGQPFARSGGTGKCLARSSASRSGTWSLASAGVATAALTRSLATPTTTT